MTKKKFRDVIENAPVWAAKFRLVRSRGTWLERCGCGFQDGDIFYYHPSGVMVPEKPYGNISPHPSRFEFVEYCALQGDVRRLFLSNGR